MAAEFSSKLAKDVLDVFFTTATTGTTFDPGSSVSLYVALTSGQTTVDGVLVDGGSGGEISGSGYGRVAVTFGAATENTTAGSASITNSGSVAFSGFTGTITSVDGFAICEAGTADVADALCYGTISTIQIDTGDTVTFAASAITISLD